ncbi:chloroplast sensor kinase [Actinidia rufa]|uniref:Chloroplast sensor kinase n=1 Tax=Actinidia rufa TaxID=165716 RepID=A0A7J0DI57_9ERIC|nr:chloroplast sensor kinase [Actinidia rufa]
MAQSHRALEKLCLKCMLVTEEDLELLASFPSFRELVLICCDGFGTSGLAVVSTRGVKWALPARHGTGMARKNSARVRFRHGISSARHGMARSERALVRVRGKEMVEHCTIVDLTWHGMARHDQSADRHGHNTIVDLVWHGMARHDTDLVKYSMGMARMCQGHGTGLCKTVWKLCHGSAEVALREAEDAISSEQAEFVLEYRAVVFPMVKHPFVVGFLVAEFPKRELKREEHGIKDCQLLEKTTPSPVSKASSKHQSHENTKNSRRLRLDPENPQSLTLDSLKQRIESEKQKLKNDDDEQDEIKPIENLDGGDDRSMTYEELRGNCGTGETFRSENRERRENPQKRKRGNEMEEKSEKVEVEEDLSEAVRGIEFGKVKLGAERIRQKKLRKIAKREKKLMPPGFEG